VELLAYIKELLLLNDCVIIPEFGGFVANYKPATIRSSQFTPPVKSISFNKKLNFNDGLFINHVASAEGLNYVAARKKVDLLVQEMNYRLTDGEKINISGIGSLQYDDQENLIFSPQVAENLNLDAFGLTPFTYKTLFARHQPSQNIPLQQQDAVQVIFQRRSLKKVLLAIPLLLALAVTPLKNNKENLLESNLASLTEMISMQNAPQPVIEEETTAVTEAIKAEADVEHPYFIIGGSFRNEENAQTFIRQMKNKGYDAQNLGIIKGLHYISLSSFATIGEAQQARDEYKRKSPGSGVWIYVKR